MHVSAIVFAAAFTLGLGVLAAPSGLQVKPLDLPAAVPDVPKVPLVADAADASWRDGKPVWEASKLDVGAKLWLATTRRSLLMHLVVQRPRPQQ